MESRIKNRSGICRNGQKAVYASVAAIVLISSTRPFVAFAGNTNIVVDNQTENESLEVEVSVGGIPCLISADTGFRYNMDVSAKKVYVDARVSKDIYGYYDLSYEPEVDIRDGGIIRITVAYSKQYGDEGEEEAFDLDGRLELEQWNPDTYDDRLPDTGMEEFDLSSDTTDAGTLVIQCQPVNAFDEVVLTLMDENYKTYQIPLHMEPYFFRAKVKLPVGKYRESGSPEVKFNEYASPDSTFSYAWAHKGGTAFGGFFDIKAGEETRISDLVIKTVKGGEAMDTDSRYYYNKKVYEEESRAEQELDARFKEKTYQSLVLNEEVSVADDNQDMGGGLRKIMEAVPMILKVMASISLLVVLSIGIRRVHERYQYNNRMY